MVRSCFVGCSFTVGEGFPVLDREHYIYDRLVAKEFGWNHTNISTGGASNYKIFMAACNAIHSKEHDILFVQWSALNRLWLYPGPDTNFFVGSLRIVDKEYRYRDIYLSADENKDLREKIQVLNHDYQNILDLIDYCNIIKSLATLYNIKLVFINGLVPWTNDLVKPYPENLNLSKWLSKYTKEILDFDWRSDEEILLFLNRLRLKFSELDQSLWVNLFNSMLDNSVDIGPEGHHPGIKSQAWMATKIIDYINANLKEIL